MSVEVEEQDIYDYDDDEDLDFADLDHPIAEVMSDNLYKILQMSPTQGNAEARDTAYAFLGDLWNSCVAADGDNSGLYVQILETIFIKFYEDLNFILKLFTPAILHTFFKQPGIANTIALQKLAFNMIFPVEASDYNYPADEPPTGPEYMSGQPYRNNGDTAFRGTWDTEHDTMLAQMNVVPESWRSTIKTYVERTAVYLYGDESDNECT